MTQELWALRWKSDVPLMGLPFDLGDMRSREGESVWWEIDKTISKIAPLLAEQISETPASQLLAEFLPSQKIFTYFQNRVTREIFPAIRALNVAQWATENGIESGPHEVFWDHHLGLGPALQGQWPSDDIPLTLGASKRLYPSPRPFLGEMLLRARHISRQWRTTSSRASAPAIPDSSGPTIAVPYQEGTDSNRRSDLFWYQEGLFDPQRILILFRGQRGPYRDRLIPESVLQDIEARGMRWLCLEHHQVERIGAPVWGPNRNEDSLLAQFRRRKHDNSKATEGWAAQASESLLRQVDYWAALYRDFDVKVHVDVVGMNDYTMAQSIALDLTNGVRIGWQRSEQDTVEGTEIGHQPNHAHFTWSARALEDAPSGRRWNGPGLVSGFPYDAAWGSDSIPKGLRANLNEKGAEFVVALFDNMVSRDALYSKAMIQNIYRSFLEWVLEDPQVGVLTKSKKPIVSKEITEIRELMARAEATGRWINLGDVFGRLPSDASRAADISVGIGISTAANEAVAAGGRAVHCDLTGMSFHSFYKWGYKKVVFDETATMMEAFKRYKDDPASEPELGDFAEHIDQVDPFRDGRSAERIGSYIGNLLSGFDRGLDRDQALQEANLRYASLWGENSVIQMRSPASAAKG